MFNGDLIILRIHLITVSFDWSNPVHLGAGQRLRTCIVENGVMERSKLIETLIITKWDNLIRTKICMLRISGNIKNEIISKKQSHQTQPSVAVGLTCERPGSKLPPAASGEPVPI